MSTVAEIAPKEKKKGQNTTLKPTQFTQFVYELFNILSKRRLTNPYSSTMERFFDEADSEQLTLLRDYSKYPVLAQWIKLVQDKKGNLVKFEFETEEYKEKYLAAKQELIATHKYNG